MSLYYQNLSIIIPAYNEEDRIGSTIKNLETNIPEIKEIIVVFDGSDNTPTVARESGNKVSVIEFNRRLGKGGAVIEGFKAATGSVVCYIDADGSSPWYEVKKICSMVSNSTPAVVGSRWVSTSKIRESEPLHRIIASRLFHYIVFATVGILVKDTQCGLKAFTNEVAKQLTEKVTIKNWTFDVAIFLHLKNMGVRPQEVGIEWLHVGESKLNILKVIPMMLITIIGLRLRHREKVSKEIKKKLEELYEDFGFY